MSLILGIDLGTTNCCMAVPGTADLPFGQLVDQRRLRRVHGAYVVLDEYESPTVPSAVWLDQDGTVTVGTLAKQQARLSGPPPALFFKRGMGTDLRLQAGHRFITPQEASTHLLRHLKESCEEALGVPVEQAVITVPAFFSARAKTETTEAGREAGLQVLETLMEPVAAALTFNAAEEFEDEDEEARRRREAERHRNLLVYDLGGGTFDASVVTWAPEAGFEMRTFDGDPHLGGYEFDQAIVLWLRDQLPKYDLAFDGTDPRDDALMATLLVNAEQVKVRLTDEPVTSVVIAVGGAEDRRGRPLNVNQRLSRKVFESLIGHWVGGTLDNCDRALTKAKIATDAVDDVVMVGGSSRIPLVAQRLQEHFGKQPISIDPDLCVAVGAAIKASTLARQSAYLVVDRSPTTTSDDVIDVTGRVLPGPLLADPRMATVQLLADGGFTRREERPGTDGGFLFTQVQLAPDRLNEFAVRALSGGQEVDSQRFGVVHDSGADERELAVDGDVLAHDFAVKLDRGNEVVAPEGTKLPFQTRRNLETASQGTRLNVVLMEGLNPIGGVEITGLSPDLPIGTAVELTLEFQRGWTIRAQATVPSAGPTARAEAVVQIPSRRVPGWDELRRRFRDVQAGWAQRRDTLSAASALRVGPRLTALLDEIEATLNVQIDPVKADHKLAEAESLIEAGQAGPAVALVPSWEEFSDRLAELRRLAERLRESDEDQGASFAEGIRAQEEAGRRAYDAGNVLDWHAATEVVNRQISAIKSILNQGDPPRSLPDAPVLKMMMLQEVHELSEAVDQLKRLPSGGDPSRIRSLRSKVTAVEAEVASVDFRRPDASQRLLDLYSTRVRPVRAELERWRDEMARGDDIVLRPSQIGLDR